jgi:uncharacterized protein
MTTLFADTSFYVALLNVRDVHHGRALDFLRAPAGQVVTTQYVVLEVGNFMRRPTDRAYFLALLEDLDHDENTSVISSSSDLLARGVELFRQRPDKSWSLTDCTSFVVMRERGITDALTADVHFRQAGFGAILLPSPT